MKWRKQTNEQLDAMIVVCRAQAEREEYQRIIRRMKRRKPWWWMVAKGYVAWIFTALRYPKLIPFLWHKWRG